MSDVTTLPIDLDQLRVRGAQGEQFEFLLFWGHQVPQDRSDAQELSQPMVSGTLHRRWATLPHGRALDDG